MRERENMNIYQMNGKCIINGIEVESPPSVFGSQIQVMTGNKIYVNYREYRNGTWKVTLMSVIQCFFA